MASTKLKFSGIEASDKGDLSITSVDEYGKIYGLPIGDMTTLRAISEWALIAIRIRLLHQADQIVQEKSDG